MARYKRRSRTIRNDPSSIGEILGNDPGVLKGSAILTHWNTVVGPIVSKQAQPLSYRDGMLWVTVSSAAWMQELQYQSESILEGLNKACGSQLVTELRFRQGRVSSSETLRKKPAPSVPSPEPSESPDPETVERIRRIVQRVSDRELRESLEQLWILAASKDPSG